MNESVGFLFQIRPATTINKPSLRVKWPEGSNRSDSISVDLACVHRVQVDRAAGWQVRSIPPRMREYDPLDALVPLQAPKGGLPARLEAGTEYVFWVDLIAARGTVAGIHHVPLVLEVLGKPLGTLDIEFAVWPAILPDEGDLLAIGEVDHVGLFRHHIPGAASNSPNGTAWQTQGLPTGGEYDRLLNNAVQLLQKHRVAPLLPKLEPQVKVSSRGEMELDWSNYDRIVGPLLDGQAFANRIPLPVWPLPFWSLLRPGDDKILNAPGSESLAKKMVEESARHFQERGWLDRSLAFVDADVALSPEPTLATKKAVELIRSTRKDIRIASRRFPQDMRSLGWFDFPKNDVSDVDVWIPDAQFYDAGAMSSERAQGRQTWLGVDRPPFSGTTALSARPSDVLVLSWQARLLNAKYLWLGCVNDWPTDLNKPDPAQCAKFDPHALIFPGSVFGLTEPVPTLRLKRIRETMQYASYARLLEQHDRGHIVQALQSSLVEYAGTGAYRTHFADGRPIGWPDKPEIFETARQIMANEMLSVAGDFATTGDKSGFGADLLWRAFMTNTRGVRARVDGARVRLMGTPLDAKAQIETWFTVSNQRREPLRATASLSGFPASCSQLEEENSLELAVGRSQRVGLTVSCDAGWLGSAHTTGLTFQMAESDREPMMTVPVRLSMIVAEPTARRLTIDGDLSDWTAAAGNVASDFRLIAGECDEGTESCAHPALSTFAFTRRDAEFLYVGINAEARPDAGPAMRRKGVTYDDLIPSDEEDLVEILIDPLNGGTRSPADLYHIVIKRSGVYLLERGITTVPPLGPRRPWQADIEVASRAQSNRWTTEVRIPLTSFDRPGTVRGEIWGFNVTHYDARQQEFGTWSGAVGNAYDPISLGNLLLP